jgi:hypothetical protein
LSERGADNPTLEKTLFTKSEEAIAGRKLAEASEEGQGPRRSIEPTMMMKARRWLLAAEILFNPQRLQVRFVVNEAALEQFISAFFVFPPVVIIPPMLHLIYHRPIRCPIVLIKQ